MHHLTSQIRKETKLLTYWREELFDDDNISSGWRLCRQRFQKFWHLNVLMFFLSFSVLSFKKKKYP